MSNSQEKFRCRFYYGAWCAADKAQGTIAVETLSTGHANRDINVMAGRSRFDIGRIDVFAEDHPNSGWVTVYDNSKTYDCSAISKTHRDACEIDPYHIYKNGPWEDDFNWKGLRNEGYTHVQTCDGLFWMGKYGPLGEAVK